MNIKNRFLKSKFSHPASFILIIFLFISSHSFGQCMMYEVSLNDRVNEATHIVEGKVINETCFWNSDQSIIYTAHEVLVYKIFKGSVTGDTIEIVTEGGIIGNKKLALEPNLQLGYGDVGIFCLKNTAVSNSPFQIPVDQKFEVVALTQGFIKYNSENLTANDVFHTYSNIEQEVYSPIETIVGSGYLENIPFTLNTPSNEFMLAPSISSFSPTTIDAGTFAVLTINGNNFGSSYTGNADVQFKNSDDGGSSWISSPASHIVSWNNTQIKVKVVSGAGTGVIRVKSSGGATGTSSGSLDILYDETNVSDANGNYYQPDIVNKNGIGGLTFKYNTSFNGNSSAVGAWERALNEWRCKTLVNFSRTGTTSISCEASDNTNVITFDNNCGVPSGVLGITYDFWDGCGGNPNWYLSEVDQKFNASPSGGWNFGPGPTTGGKYDFQSVCLHELGHAHQLGHVINNAEVMHYSIGTNSDKRVLDQNSDVAGGEDVLSRSVINNTCGPSATILLDSTACSLNAPAADFSATPLSGCVPLTVAFTDLSLNSPTTWAWDIDNNGSVDYTIPNPTHTYNSVGTYTVKLTASNSSGTSTTTKTNYISVTSPPAASAGPDQTVCLGHSVTLTASGGGTYHWSNGFNAPSITVTPGDTTGYSVTVTLNGCAATDSATVFVLANPQANAGNDVTICQGESTLLTGTGGATYHWSNGSGNASITVSPQTTTIYALTVTSNNGCTATDSVSVNVNPAPTPNIGSDVTICSGQSTTLQANYPGTYLWSDGETTEFITVSPTTITQYSVTVTDNLSCTASDAVTVNVTPPPVVQLNYTQTGLNAQFTDMTAGATAWSWNFGDGAGSTLQNPTHTYSTIGTYQVCLTVTTSTCSNDSCFNITINNVGIANIESGQVHLYPNPVSKILTVDLGNLSPLNNTLELIDLKGAILFTQNTSNRKYQIDLSKFAAGTYFLKIISSDGIAIRKIVKAD